MSDGSANINVDEWFSRLTLDIIGEAGFGYSFNTLQDNNNELANAYKGLMTPPPGGAYRVIEMIGFFFPMTQLIPFSYRRGRKRSRDLINRTGYEIIKSKKDAIKTGESEGTDILGLMVANNTRAEKSEGPNTSNVMSDHDMNEQLMTFLLAGHETTSTALGWSLFYLCKRPEFQTRLRQELVQEVGDDTSNAQAIENCKLLNNVVSEVARFSPPVTVTNRTNREDVRLPSGHFVPKETPIFLAIAAINQHPDIWGPEAGVFDPDRWDRLPGNLSSLAHLTFLAGPRSCLGRVFALLEWKVILATLLLKFDFKLANGIDWEPERYSFITMHAKGGIPFTVTKLGSQHL